MLKKSILTFLIITVIFTACKKQKESEAKVENHTSINDFDSITVKKLPHAFAFDRDSILDYHYTLEAFESSNKIDKESKLNTYFSDSTSFFDDERLFITDSKNYPYIGEGYFYARLPDINDIKVLIFTYENVEEPETLPYFEIQTFDSNGDVIDKLILAGGINYDCSWDRQFLIDTTYNITIIDNESCFDREDEKQILTKTIENFYKINNKGTIEVVKDDAVL